MTSLQTLTAMVQAFTVSTMTVTKGLGLPLKLDRKRTGPGMKASASCAAALIGVIGDDMKGSVTILTDHGTFKETITTMSGGMIKDPKTDDSLAMSALGELANMICGTALKEFGKFHPVRIDITPPQLFAGDNLRSVPSDLQGIKYFTILLQGEKGHTIYVVLGFQ